MHWQTLQKTLQEIETEYAQNRTTHLFMNMCIYIFFLLFFFIQFIYLLVNLLSWWRSNLQGSFTTYLYVTGFQSSLVRSWRFRNNFWNLERDFWHVRFIFLGRCRLHFLFIILWIFLESLFLLLLSLPSFSGYIVGK